MASNASLANKIHYEKMAANAGSPMTPEEVIEYNDIHWTALTADPRGVDYAEVDAAGQRAMWITPKDTGAGPVILYSHGGGFVSGSIYTHRKMVGHIAKAAGCRALIYDYPYAHQAKYPAQLDATVAVYRWLLSEGYDPGNIILGGDSCGAIMAIGTLQRASSEGLPRPAGVFLISGWLDLTLNSPTFEENAHKDLFFTRQAVDWLASNFLGDGDRRDPMVSAVFANPNGFPPIYMQAGEDEALVGESRTFATMLESASVEVKIDLFPEMLHSFQMMAGRAPEADDAISRIGEWVRARLSLTTLKVA